MSSFASSPNWSNLAILKYGNQVAPIGDATAAPADGVAAIDQDLAQALHSLAHLPLKP